MIQYKDKLKDSRWLAKRQAILARDSFRCAICGSNNGLNVHHSAYIYGREPWEYDNKYLVTLCHECHAKLHGKNATKQTYRGGIIFYRALLNDRRGLTANDLIYYSFLVSKSIAIIDGVFSVDGKLNVDVMNELISNAPFQFMATFTIDEVSKNTGISKSAVSLCKKRLIDAGLMKGELIKITSDIVNGGYFPLLAMGRLKGELLIFYSFLKSVSANYKYIINLNKYNIAVNYGWTDKSLSIKQLVFRLKNMGLIAKKNKILMEVL